MQKKKGYITLLLLLISVYAIAKSKSKKPKSRIIVDQPITQNAYSVIGGTVYKDDLVTPIYTFRNSIKLGILDYDPDFDMNKVSFTALNTVMVGWLDSNKIIYK